MNTQEYADYSSLGEIDTNGSIRVMLGSEAVENSLRMWISSFRGEMIKSPRKGGYIVQWLMKPMNEETKESIRNAIIDGLFNDFQPRVNIIKLDVVPDYENQYWTIRLKGYCPLIKETVDLSTKLRRLTS